MLEGMLQMQLASSADVLIPGASIPSSVNPDPKVSQTSGAASAQEQWVRSGENL
jgi:hypothetical protein